MGKWYKVLNQKDGKLYKTYYGGTILSNLEAAGLIVLCEIEDPSSSLLPII